MAELHDDFATRYGLVRIGGDLAPATLLQAYCTGVFPWFDEGWPICWWSPEPRAIFELNGGLPLTPNPSPQGGEGSKPVGPPLTPDPESQGGEGSKHVRPPLTSGPGSQGREGSTGFHLSRRLARTLRSGKFKVTINQAFGAVIRGCADRDEGSWITPTMIDAYERLHRLGVAHSVETWRDAKLAGGLYGVALAGFFAGESMFHRISDGSNVALAFTVEHLRQRGFQLFDTQFLTEHTARLGAVEIPRQDYLERLQQALQVKTTFVED